MFEIMKKAFDIGGYDQLEVYAEKEETIDCQVAKDEIENVKTDNLRGIGIRALVDNKIGFAYTTDPESVKDAAEKAVKLSRLSQNPIISFPVKSDFPDIGGVFHKEVAETTEEQLIESTEKAISRGDASFSEGSTSRVIGDSYIMNSSGLEGHRKSTYFSSFFSANRNQQSKYWFETTRGKHNPVDTAEKALDLLDRSSNPVELDDKGERTVVLTPYAQYQIFSGILYPAFSAERVQRGKSPFQDKKGEKVASESLNIVDEGLREEGVNSRSFDREGTPSKNTDLIQDGVLENYLYDLKRAEKEGLESTGNASGGYSSTPSISPTNMVLKGEEGSEDEVKDAIIIQDVAGVHTANKTSGDFSLNITTGFEVSEGEERPIEGGLFVGNIFELLKNHKFFYGDYKSTVSLVTKNAVFRDQKIVV